MDRERYERWMNAGISVLVPRSLPGNRPGYGLLGAAAGFGLNALCVLGARLTGSVSPTPGSFEPPRFLWMLAYITIRAVAEELVFREIMYRRLTRDIGNPKIVLAVTSLTFMIFHLFNPGIGVLSAVNLALLGLFCGLLVFRLDSFWAACAFHAAWNVTQSVIFGVRNSGCLPGYALMTIAEGSEKSGFFYDAAFGVEGSPGCTLLIIAACAAVWFAGRRMPAGRENPPSDATLNP